VSQSPPPPTGERCQARTRKGERCRNPAGPGGLCAVHRRRLEGALHPQPRAGGAPERRPAASPPAGGAPEQRPAASPPAGGAPEREGSRSGNEEVRVVHTPPGRPAEGGATAVHTTPDEGEPDLGPLGPLVDWAEEALEFLGRRLLGEYEVDEFGHDPDLVEHVLAPLLRPLYRHWWRVETTGLEHVPDSGPALVVGNHAGTLPFDALMVALALLDEHPAHRSLRMLAADLAFDLPIVAPLARKSGNTLACAEDATRLLEAGELVVRYNASPPDAFLADIATSAITLVGGPGRDRLRRCGAPGCGRWFVASRPRQRWCSPTCGNRARVARFQERRGTEPA